MIEPGRFKARAVEGPLFGVAKTGTKQVAITFLLGEGPNLGQEVTWIGYLSKGKEGAEGTQPWERALETIAKCGWPKGKKLNDLTADDLTNEVNLTLAIEEWEGKERVKVTWVNLPGEGGFKFATPIVGDELRKFAADWDRAASRFSGMHEGKQPDDSDGPPPPGDDDVPF